MIMVFGDGGVGSLGVKTSTSVSSSGGGGGERGGERGGGGEG